MSNNNFNYKKSSAIPLQKKKKGINFKSVSFWIILFFILFWSVGSALSVAMFTEKNVKKAYADESVTVNYFTGSNLYNWQILKTNVAVSSPSNEDHMLYENTLFGVSFHSVGNNFFIDNLTFMTSNFVSASYTTQVDYDNYTQRIQTSDYASIVNLDYSQSLPLYCNLVFGNTAYGSNFYRGLFLGFERSQTFGKVAGVSFGRVDTIPYTNSIDRAYTSTRSLAWDYNLSKAPFFVIRYFDTDNNYVMFYTNIHFNVLYDYRTYYFSNDGSQEYLDGYNTGLSQGKNESQPIIYQNGYDNGYQIGYETGYQTGTERGSEYSFTNLLGAVVDAPITVIGESLNFEILGVNLASFFFGLITICIIVFVVKLFL